MTTTLPVLIAARHVRLSAAHLEVLFGAKAALVDICALPPTSTFVSDKVVDVRGSAGTLKQVRVIGPVTKATAVRVSSKDAAVLGDGVTLEGPHGTVVLADGLVVGLRRVVVTAAHKLADGARVSVTVRGERERELRDVPVSVSDVGGWVEVDVDDANALEIGPTSVATL